MPVGGSWHIDDFAYRLGKGWVVFRRQVLVPGRSKPTSLKQNCFHLEWLRPGGGYTRVWAGTAATTEAASSRLPSERDDGGVSRPAVGTICGPAAAVAAFCLAN
jgi:hypothetical protein